MKAFPKVGLLLVVALLASAAVATSAQAVSFNPHNTAVSGLSSDPIFFYGVGTWRCHRATMDGNTGLDSDRITDLALTFTDNCYIWGGFGRMPAEVDCVGTVTLIADPAADDTATVELPEGFQCVATTPSCTYTIAGPQTTQPKNTFLDEASDVLSVNMEVQATREGGSSWSCGPTSAPLSYSANYAMTPSNLTIDP